MLVSPSHRKRKKEKSTTRLLDGAFFFFVCTARRRRLGMSEQSDEIPVRDGSFCLFRLQGPSRQGQGMCEQSEQIPGAKRRNPGERKQTPRSTFALKVTEVSTFMH